MKNLKFLLITLSLTACGNAPVTPIPFTSDSSTDVPAPITEEVFYTIEETEEGQKTVVTTETVREIVKEEIKVLTIPSALSLNLYSDYQGKDAKGSLVGEVVSANDKNVVYLEGLGATEVKLPSLTEIVSSASENISTLKISLPASSAPEAGSEDQRVYNTSECKAFSTSGPYSFLKTVAGTKNLSYTQLEAVADSHYRLFTTDKTVNVTMVNSYYQKKNGTCFPLTVGDSFKTVKFLIIDLPSSLGFTAENGKLVSKTLTVVKTPKP